MVRTLEIIDKVHDFVAIDHNASLKMIEKILNTSRGTIRNILHEDLDKMEFCTKVVLYVLRSD